MSTTVFIGGVLGTEARYLLETRFATSDGAWPWGIFVMNVSGALLLGMVLRLLAAFGPDEGWWRLTRVGVGTGVLGGFTTYSAFALQVDQALISGSGWLGCSYALVSVFSGAGAAYAGTVLGQFLASRTHRTTRAR